MRLAWKAERASRDCRRCAEPRLAGGARKRTLCDVVVRDQAPSRPAHDSARLSVGTATVIVFNRAGYQLADEGVHSTLSGAGGSRCASLRGRQTHLGRCERLPAAVPAHERIHVDAVCVVPDTLGDRVK